MAGRLTSLASGTSGIGLWMLLRSAVASTTSTLGRARPWKASFSPPTNYYQSQRWLSRRRRRGLFQARPRLWLRRSPLSCRAHARQCGLRRRRVRKAVGLVSLEWGRACVRFRTVSVPHTETTEPSTIFVSRPNHTSSSPSPAHHHHHYHHPPTHPPTHAPQPFVRDYRPRDCESDRDLRA